MVLPLLVLLSAPAHAAAPVGDVEAGWYLLRSQRPEAALRQAVAALAEDPQDVDAHLLYVEALGQGLREGPAVRRLYADWAAAEPGSDLARVVAAHAVAAGRSDAGPWCDEVAALLDPLPVEPALLARAIRVRTATRRYCPGDPDEGLDTLRALAPTEPRARRPVLTADLADRDVSEADAALVALYVAEESQLAWLAGLVWHEQAHGEGLAAARAAIGAAVDRAEAADDPVLLESAALVLRRIPDQEARAEALEARRDALDPDHAVQRVHGNGTVQWMPHTLPGDAETWRALARAYDKRPAPVALLALSRLEDSVPADGPLRATYERHVADHLWWSLQRRAAVARARAAWQADPTLEHANAWGYDAALADVDTEAALAAVDQALAAGLAWDPRGDTWGDGYTQWQPEAADLLRDVLDTRGWLLWRLGRLEEARRDLRQAVLTGRPSPVVHLHLGLVEHALDDPEGALLHLSRGLALGGGDEPRLRARARAVLRPLLQQRRYSPRGLDAWVTARWPEEEAAPEAASRPPATDHWRVGQAFPDLALHDREGASQPLSAVPGVRVVDLWATWCGPCIAALPHLSDVARAYADRGVRVLALSVDAEAQVAWEWKAGPRDPAYESWWVGADAWKEARIGGIPATFVLDGEGRIRAFFSGYGEDDTRLEDALEALLP